MNLLMNWWLYTLIDELTDKLVYDMINEFIDLLFYW